MPETSEPNTVPQIFDRALVARRLSRRIGQSADFVTRLVIDDMNERLATITRRFEKAAILGPDAQMLPAGSRSALGEIIFVRFSTLAMGNYPIADPERLALPSNDYDLIVTLLDLQVVNDVPGFLGRLRSHLRPDGLVLAAAIGGGSLGELREAFLLADSEMSGGAYPRVAPFIDVRAAGSLLQRAGLALPVTDSDKINVRYSEPLALMRELKALGAANPMEERAGKMVTRGLLDLASKHYQRIAGDEDGRVRATLEIIWLSGWAPDPSQQKPLAPGSATTSLKDVLGKG